MSNLQLYKVKSAKNIKHHMIKIHREKLNCNECTKSFERRYQLIVHQGIHTEDKLFLCPDCPKKFKTISELKSHSFRHMDPDRKCSHYTHEKPFECTDCGKSFPVKAAMKDHSRTHDLSKCHVKYTKEKPLICNVCGKAL